MAGGRIRHIGMLAELCGQTDEYVLEHAREMAFQAAGKMRADAVLGPAFPSVESEIGASMNIHHQARFDSPEAVVEWIENQPAHEELCAAGSKARYDGMANDYRAGWEKASGLFFLPFGMGCTCGFHHYYEFFGMEQFMMAYLLYPEAIHILNERNAVAAAEHNQIVARLIRDLKLPPYVWFGEDMCDNRGSMVSPAMLAELYFPYAARAVEPLREAGVRIIWHSDGNIMPIADQLLGVVGVDGFQGFQTETGVDIGALSRIKTVRGEAPILIGGVNNVTMVSGNPGQVLSELEAMEQIGKERGGVILSVSCSSGPEVQRENILAMREFAARRG